MALLATPPTRCPAGVEQSFSSPLGLIKPSRVCLLSKYYSILNMHDLSKTEEKNKHLRNRGVESKFCCLEAVQEAVRSRCQFKRFLDVTRSLASLPDSQLTNTDIKSSCCITAKHDFLFVFAIQKSSSKIQIMNQNPLDG